METETKVAPDAVTKVVNKKKKRNPILSFFRGIFIFLLVLILILVLWCGFSALHKKASLSLLPNNYSAFIQTESVWDALNPIIDLQVADVVLSTPELASVKEAFVAFRKSPLREKFYVKWLMSRPVDIGIYMNGNKTDIVGVIDMGVFSAATRLSKIILPFFKIEGLSLVENSDLYYFEFQLDSESSIYIKPYRNTVIISTNLDLLTQACKGDNDKDYSKNDKNLLSTKTENPLKILADANSLVKTFSAENPAIEKFSGLLSSDSKALVSLGIKDSEIQLKAEIPLEKDTSKIDSSLLGINNLLTKNSSMPQLLGQLSNIVQYYTIINAGSIQELTQAAFPLIPPETDIESLWKKANSLCKSVFSLTLDDLLFSWTGKECAAIGIEGLNAPVFVLQVKDEAKRKEVFDNVLSSFILKDDTSLILNGIRLPKIQLPGFLESLLNVFGIELPNPYYLVHNGYVYFSESPEVLSSVYNSSITESRISSNTNWQIVSEKQTTDSSLSLFYDLERSKPFFVRGDNLVSTILELYAIGRCDIRIRDSVLIFQLSVATKPTGQIRSISGFPVQLDGIAKQLQIEGTTNPNHIFWVENNKIVKSMNIHTTEIKEMEMSSNVSIISSANASAGAGVLWAVTQDGGVYNFNADLSLVTGFPILLDSKPSSSPSASKNGLIVPLERKEFCLVSSNGTKSLLNIEKINGSVLAAPTVLDETIAYYDKGFLGNVVVHNKNDNTTYKVSGIAYGTPAILKKDLNTYTGFITQAGNLSIWCDNFTVPGFPIEKRLNGVFYTNVVTNGNYFYALASHGTLYRIALDGELIAVRIPNATAKEGSLTIAKSDSTGESNIFVGIDGNIIYGFNENLELLSGFPLTGTGSPVFTDANGDGYTDCFVLTIDNKVNAWKLR